MDEKEIKSESHLRSILKGVTWRVIGTLDTMVISWFLTGSLTIAVSIGGIEVFSKLLLYYLHERAWQMAPRGSVRKVYDVINWRKK